MRGGCCVAASRVCPNECLLPRRQFTGCLLQCVPRMIGTLSCQCFIRKNRLAATVLQSDSSENLRYGRERNVRTNHDTSCNAYYHAMATPVLLFRTASAHCPCTSLVIECCCLLDDARMLYLTSAQPRWTGTLTSNCLQDIFRNTDYIWLAKVLQ